MAKRCLTLDEAVNRILEEDDEEDIDLTIIPPGKFWLLIKRLLCKFIVINTIHYL